jgi:hypothetical protein
MVTWIVSWTRTLAMSKIGTPARAINDAAVCLIACVVIFGFLCARSPRLQQVPTTCPARERKLLRSNYLSRGLDPSSRPLRPCYFRSSKPDSTVSRDSMGCVSDFHLWRIMYMSRWRVTYHSRA